MKNLYLGGIQTGTKTNGYQNANFSKLKELAILKRTRFDPPLGAAKETPKIGDAPERFKSRYV